MDILFSILPFIYLIIYSIFLTICSSIFLVCLIFQLSIQFFPLIFSNICPNFIICWNLIYVKFCIYVLDYFLSIQICIYLFKFFYFLLSIYSSFICYNLSSISNYLLKFTSLSLNSLNLSIQISHYLLKFWTNL